MAGMKAKNLALAVSLSVFLVPGCGGGGGGSPATPPAPPPPPPPVAVPFGGLWFGTVTYDGSPVTEEAVGFVTEDGRFRLLALDGTTESMTLFAGRHSFDNGSIAGSGAGLAPPGVSTWLDGSTVTGITTTGTLNPQDSFIGEWFADAGDTGSFEFFYDAEYERPSSLSLLAGVWTVFDDLGNPTATFTIESNGLFTAQNTFGCTSAGEFLISDSAYNIYLAVSTISNCALDGNYTSMAIVADVASANDAIVLTIDNGNLSIVAAMLKEP